MTLNDRHAEPQFSWQILCYANSWCKAKWCKAKGEVGAAPTNTPPVRLIQNCFCHKNSENNATRPLFKLNALSLSHPSSSNFPQHSRQSSKTAYRPTEIILHTLLFIMSRSRRLPLPLPTLRNIFATASLFTSHLTPPYTALTLKNYPPYRKCSAGLTLWFWPVNSAGSAVLFEKEFFMWRRPFHHFILLESTFAHDLWQPFTLIENVSGDVALWYRPGAPTYFAVPFEKTSGLFSSAYAPRNRSEHTNHPFIFSSVSLRWLVERHILAR